jgi:hypothetical protein
MNSLSSLTSILFYHIPHFHQSEFCPCKIHAHYFARYSSHSFVLIMRFSPQSLAICLLSAQARVVLAGPCKPLATTSVGATTTTATLSEEPTTTIEGGASTVAISDEPTTTTLPNVSTVTTLAEESVTTTTAETTTAAGTTATTSAPEFSLFAQYDDNSPFGVYLQSDYFVGTNADGSVKADFALETDTSRLYVSLSDGSKLYASTVIPQASKYGFLFHTYDRISQNPNTYHFITCTADSELYLTCYSEIRHTRIYWYKPSNSPNFYGHSNSVMASSFGNIPTSFKLSGGQ